MGCQLGLERRELKHSLDRELISLKNIRKCKDFTKVTHGRACLNLTTTFNQHSGLVNFLHLDIHILSLVTKFRCGDHLHLTFRHGSAAPVVTNIQEW